MIMTKMKTKRSFYCALIVVSILTNIQGTYALFDFLKKKPTQPVQQQQQIQHQTPGQPQQQQQQEKKSFFSKLGDKFTNFSVSNPKLMGAAGEVVGAGLMSKLAGGDPSQAMGRVLGEKVVTTAAEKAITGATASIPGAMVSMTPSPQQQQTPLQLQPQVGYPGQAQMMHPDQQQQMFPSGQQMPPFMQQPTPSQYSQQSQQQPLHHYPSSQQRDQLFVHEPELRELSTHHLSRDEVLAKHGSSYLRGIDEGLRHDRAEELGLGEDDYNNLDYFMPEKMKPKKGLKPCPPVLDYEEEEEEEEKPTHYHRDTRRHGKSKDHPSHEHEESEEEEEENYIPSTSHRHPRKRKARHHEHPHEQYFDQDPYDDWESEDQDEEPRHPRRRRRHHYHRHHHKEHKMADEEEKLASTTSLPIQQQAPAAIHHCPPPPRPIVLQPIRPPPPGTLPHIGCNSLDGQSYVCRVDKNVPLAPQRIENPMLSETVLQPLHKREEHKTAPQQVLEHPVTSQADNVSLDALKKQVLEEQTHLTQERDKLIEEKHTLDALEHRLENLEKDLLIEQPKGQSQQQSVKSEEPRINSTTGVISTPTPVVSSNILAPKTVISQPTNTTPVIMVTQPVTPVQASPPASSQNIVLLRQPSMSTTMLPSLTPQSNVVLTTAQQTVPVLSQPQQITLPLLEEHQAQKDIAPKKVSVKATDTNTLSNINLSSLTEPYKTISASNAGHVSTKGHRLERQKGSKKLNLSPGTDEEEEDEQSSNLVLLE